VGEGRAVSLTDKAIEQIRELIRSGALAPGSKLPPEQDLAAQLGLSRNLAREAVKALAVARVLEVRRGDGTYVTSLQPSLLLEGLGGAVELLQGDSVAAPRTDRHGPRRDPHLGRPTERGGAALGRHARGPRRRRPAQRP
jgi:DNA-binding GntR family transcriptional regulator